MNAKANNTIDKVRKLQRKLYHSAKTNKKRRFHALYDKIYREDILIEAWKRVKANKGTSGIDKVTLEDIEIYGVDKFLSEIKRDIEQGTYHPKPVKRSYIPKKDGKMRPLGIPIIKDRVIQMATKLVIEPIFESDFLDCSYGFRPKRNAHTALEKIRKKCNNYGYWVLDADIKSYFDNINHDKLIILIEQRISDRRIIKLINKWLKAGIFEKGQIYENEIGAPQGGVISPLLSNIYLNYFDRLWDKYYSHLGTLVRYADDFVIISKTKKDIHHAYKIVKEIFKRLELEIHEGKTKVVNLWGGKDGFDFLGFHHRRNVGTNAKGIKYSTTVQFPSAKAMNKMRERIKEAICNRATLKSDMKEMVKTLNRKIVGYRNYYGLKYASRQLRKIDWYITVRFTIWYNHKTQSKPRHGNISEVRRRIYKLGLERIVS